MSWNVFPPSVLTSSTPPSKPRLGSSLDASRLKLCRKVNDEDKTGGKKVSESRLSLTTAGSSMNAAFGGVSAGGFGAPEFDVTQSGGGPCAFVASQSGGNAGGVTLSKFSFTTTGSKQGGEHEGAAMALRPRRRRYRLDPIRKHCLEGPAFRTACRRENEPPHPKLSGSQKYRGVSLAWRTIATPWHQQYVV
jgi:hypothetical protein